MPITARNRIESLVADLGSRAEVARALQVDRSQVTRWLDRDQDPGPDNLRKVEGVELALARLLRLYDHAAALRWLDGLNAQLGGRRPIDLLSRGRLSEVLDAIDADELGSFA
jgi:uncharacterized protein (DUF2384 family)